MTTDQKHTLFALAAFVAGVCALCRRRSSKLGALPGGPQNLQGQNGKTIFAKLQNLKHMANYSAIGMAKGNWPHGQIVSNIITDLKRIVAEDTYLSKKYVVNTDTRYIQENLRSMAPDVYLIGAPKGQTDLIIEITDRKDREKKKAVKYRKNDFYKGELYVYDYIKKKWFVADSEGDLQEAGEKIISPVLKGFDLKTLNTSYKVLNENGEWVIVK